MSQTSSIFFFSFIFFFYLLFFFYYFLFLFIPHSSPPIHDCQLGDPSVDIEEKGKPILEAMTELLHADAHGSFITGRVPRAKRVAPAKRAAPNSQKSAENIKDHKTRLQNLLARDQKALPHYTVAEDLGQSVNTRFKATVYVGAGSSQKVFIGARAVSKKQAEHNAAKVALETILPQGGGGSRQARPAASSRSAIWRARGLSRSPSPVKVPWDERPVKPRGPMPVWRSKRGLGGWQQEKVDSGVRVGEGGGVGRGEGGSGLGSRESGQSASWSPETAGGKKQAYSSAMRG